MKISMCIWAGTVKGNLPDWFVHKGEIEVSDAQELLKKSGEIFATGNNVMLYHGKDDTIFLFVDDRRFSQR